MRCKPGSSFGFLVLGLVVLLPWTASAHDELLIRALSHFQQAPPNEYLDRFEPGLMEKLLAIIDDDGVPRLARQRAIFALTKFPEEEEAFERLAHLAAEVDIDPTLRLVAIGALGQSFGHHQETLDVLESVLSDPDPGLRARAVRAIFMIGTERSETILSRHRVVERHVLVRRALRGALEATIARPLPPEGRMRRIDPPSAPPAGDGASDALERPTGNERSTQ